MSGYDQLSSYEQWMVRSNLETVLTTGVSAAEQAAQLRANGYPKIAAALIELVDRVKSES